MRKYHYIITPNNSLEYWILVRHIESIGYPVSFEMLHKEWPRLLFHAGSPQLVYLYNDYKKEPNDRHISFSTIIAIKTLTELEEFLI